MAGFSKVILMGNLTKDPELRITSNGISICKFSIAISRKYKSQDGSQKEEVTFVDIDSFGKQAEVISKYFIKGKPIFIEGRLKLDQWESNGEKKSKLNTILETFQFVGGNKDTENNSSTSENSSQLKKPNVFNNNTQFDIDDDLPF